MTTPEAGFPAGLPAELRLALNGPSNVEPAAHVPTPGVSSGVTRIPTAPTHPEPESKLLAMQSLEGPQAPNASPPSARWQTPSTPTAGAVGGPFVAGNPFTSEPQFGGWNGLLATPELPQDFRLALSDEPTNTVPQAGASQNESAPTHGVHPTRPALAPATQIDPLVVLDLRQPETGIDGHALRKEFPILEERVHGKRLVWLDNAATTQKPKAVIDRLQYFYQHENSNIHRAAHALAARATDAYEGAREAVRRFVNAPSTDNIVFVRGTTEGINFIAQSWGRQNIDAGDEIVVSHLEHHANIVPWQMLCKEKGATLKVIPVDEHGQLRMDAYEALLGPKTKLVSVTQVSNALGTITPAPLLVSMAHRHGIPVLLDAAQSVSHMRVDVQALDCEFLVFSGHKVFAPTGIGAVYAKKGVLDAMPPWQGGGNMIADVTFERTIFQPPPARFEAGTGNIADAVGLGAALDWLTRVGIEKVAHYEHALLEYGTHKLLEIPGLRMIGTALEKAGVLSFTIEGYDTQAIAKYLDREGVAVRGGHHCAQPILRRFGVESTVRASLAPYNTTDDLDVLVEALCRLPATL